GPDWHLDAREVATFEAYVNERRLTGDETKPMRLETFLDYVGWFMGQYNLAPQNKYVTHLARSRGGYLATMDDGSRLFADSVLLALGFAFFKHYPRDIVEKLPAPSYFHKRANLGFHFSIKKNVLV